MANQHGRGENEEQDTVGDEEQDQLQQIIYDNDGATLQTLRELAQELRDSKDTKAQLALKTKSNNAEIDDISQTIISCMTSLGMKSTVFEGIGKITVKVEKYPNYSKAAEGLVFDTLENLGMGDLIQPKLAVATFRKWFKDEAERRDEAGEPELMSEFGGAVTQFEKNTVSLTKK